MHYPQNGSFTTVRTDKTSFQRGQCVSPYKKNESRAKMRHMNLHKWSLEGPTTRVKPGWMHSHSFDGSEPRGLTTGVNTNWNTAHNHIQKFSRFNHVRFSATLLRHGKIILTFAKVTTWGRSPLIVTRRNANCSKSGLAQDSPPPPIPRSSPDSQTGQQGKPLTSQLQ